MSETTWREELIRALAENGEDWSNVESCTLTDEQLDRKFDPGFKVAQRGEPFTLWTTAHVYFPLVYDGSEEVGCVSRNPDGKPTRHKGYS